MARQSDQHKLDRVRPPRVQISYDVEVGGAVKNHELPFVVGVLADLSGNPVEPLPPLPRREFVEIDLDQFNGVLAGMKPRLELLVDNNLSGDDGPMAIELRFQHIDDFEPARVANQVEPLRKLLETRQQLCALLAKTDGNDLLRDRLQEIVASRELLQQITREVGRDAPGCVGDPHAETQRPTGGTKAAETAATVEKQEARGLIERVIAETRMGRDEEQRRQSSHQIATLVEEVVQGTLRVSGSVEAAIEARIVEIDDLLSRQLNPIMHAERFQRLEAAWRGLHYLVSQTESSTMLKLRALNVSMHDLREDLEKAIEFGQSALFNKVYRDEYGKIGGTPFGALIGDYAFGRSPRDLALLERVASVAAAAHAPFIAAASPDLFNLDSFADLSAPRDLAKGFDTVEYAKWRSFRESEDSRYVGLTMPHILMRLPYGPETTPVEAFNFTEDVAGDHKKYLWGNAAYAFGTCLTNAFAKYFWCAAIRGVDGGGLVQGLPVSTFMTDEGEVRAKCPTEIAITDRREKELADLGFIPLLHRKGTDYAAFFSTQSCQEPRTYAQGLANANARLSTQLQCVLTTARFAHYLKAMMRDTIGNFMSRGDCERFLNEWISTYVLADDDASPAIKARFPLREARIDVAEVAGKPGVYKAVVFIRPHFQLDELSVSLRLVVELPTPAWH